MTVGPCIFVRAGALPPKTFVPVTSCLCNLIISTQALWFIIVHTAFTSMDKCLEAETLNQWTVIFTQQYFL
uniref:Uncharacterized protein n=1 Tax=Anguilla anguilla TaxID=7936 RepID=A0A0E9XF41_ANGAN